MGSLQLLRLAIRAPLARVPQRTLGTSAVSNKAIVLDQQLRDDIHPKIGSRDIVGYGSNGNAVYWDQPGFPCPAIRFKEPTPEVLQLQEKEKGDWKALLRRRKPCTGTASARPTQKWRPPRASGSCSSVLACLLSSSLDGPCGS